MKRTGHVCRIDDLGRIVIPGEIRSAFGLYEGDPVELLDTGFGSITIIPVAPHAEYIRAVEQIEKIIKNDLALENRQNILSAIYILKGELRKGAKQEEQNEMA